MTDRTAPPPRILFIEEVAALIRVPVKTLRHWRLHGTGPKSTRMGRRVVYREADVEARIAAQFDGPA